MVAACTEQIFLSYVRIVAISEPKCVFSGYGRYRPEGEQLALGYSVLHTT